MSASLTKLLRHAAVAALLATSVAACSSSGANDGVQPAPHEGAGQPISPSPTTKQGGG